MKLAKVFFVLIVVLLLANGCKKEEKSKMDLLTQHTWIVKTATVDPSLPLFNDYGVIIGYTNDLFSQLEGCQKDNTTAYYSNGKVKYDEGASKCDVNDPQTTEYNWTFNTDETIITENDGQGNTFTYNILKLDENSMTQSSIQKIQNINYTITITLEPA